jgi:hypothetical protein
VADEHGRAPHAAGPLATAAGIWEGLKFVAPIAFSVLLGIFGIPA